MKERYATIIGGNKKTSVEISEIIEHTEQIIEDNICYGIKMLSRDKNFSMSDVEEYSKQAHKELKELKRYLKSNSNPMLIFEKETERYIPYD